MTLRSELQVKLDRLKVHPCKKCTKVFTNISDLVAHESFHENWLLTHAISAYVSVERAKIFKCDSCTQSFATNRNFMLHRLEHIQTSVNNERRIKRLQLENDTPKPYQCPKCDVKFVAQSTLEEHSILHLPFPFICDCGIGYYKQADLRCHIKLVHGTQAKPTVPQNGTPEKQITPERKGKGPTLKAVLVQKKKPEKKKRPNNWRIKLKDKGTDKNDNNTKYWTPPHPNIEIKKTPENLYKCPECGKLLSSKVSAYTHYRIHTGERPYSCKFCNKAFNQCGTLLAHIKRIHTVNEKKYKCRHCPKAFTEDYYRARHEEIHGEKTHECAFCGKSFHDPSAVIRHERIHTGDKRYKCPYCPKAFCDVSAVRAHKLRHENKKLFKCEICLKKFYRQSDVKAHLVFHSQQRNFTCDYCKKSYTTKYNLAKHIQGHTIMEKKFECKQCQKKFLTKEYLQVHIKRIHKTKSRSKHFIECDICSAQFAHKSSFQSHFLKQHSGIHCDKCSRYFASQSLLERHYLKEPVQCEICDEKFICENVIDKHFKSHVGRQACN